MLDLFRFDEQSEGQLPVESEVGSLGVAELLRRESIVERSDRREPVDRFSSHFGDPIGHPNPPIFEDQILKLSKIVSLVVVRLDLFDQNIEEIHVVLDLVGFSL